MTERGATELLAGYTASLRLGDLPPAVIQEARRCLLNFVGCALGGHDHDVAKAIVLGLTDLSGPPSASMIGLNRRADPFLAALYNGTCASAHSFDDTHGEAIVHAGSPVCAAALALAQSGGHGNMLVAIAAGVEAMCRLSKAISVAPAVGNIAWYQTGVTGGVGTAIAASLLLGLDQAQTANAIGIAVSQASGTRIMQGSMAMLMLAGHTAQCGIRAALLARQGMEAPTTSIEGKYGFAELYSTKAHLAWLTGDLGKRHDILSNTYKSYPAGVVLHPVIDACRALKAKHPEISADTIDTIAVHIHETAVVLTNRPDPAARTEGQVSAQHWTVMGLISDTLGLRKGMLDTLRDPTIAALRKKVRLVTADPSFARDAAQVAVTLKSGKTLTSEVYRGCAPMHDAQIEGKFAGQANGVLPDRNIKPLAAAIWALRENDGAQSLGELL